MRNDPFIIKEEGGDIKDRGLGGIVPEIDGDIVVADSYRKHPRYQWAKFRNNSALFYACLFLFIALGSRLYYLQVVRGAEYYGAAEENRIREQAITAPRGVIFDKNGARLAYNVPDFALYVVPGDLPKRQEEEDEIFNEIARIIGKEHFDLMESFARVSRTSFNPVEIARGLTQEQAVTLSRRAEDWQGVVVHPVEQRFYLSEPSLSHVLGYTGKMSEEEFQALRSEGYSLPEHIGKTGIEKIYQTELHGRNGAQLIEVDSLGKEKKMFDQRAPVPGFNLYLNLDLDLQQLAGRELEAAVKKLRAPGGVVIALDPRSGAVRALASYPWYDNNLFAKGIDAKSYNALLADPNQPLFNRAVSGEYPSGSTFKLVVGTAALAEGVASEHFTVLSTGGLNINNYFFPDWKACGHGLTDIRRAIAESVNTYFYTVGGGYGDIAGLGLERIVDYGRRFGLTALSGIDLPSESAGFLPAKDWKLKTKGERWFLGDTYHLAIGQGDILVTPLQVADFTAVIANGGTLYKPHLVEKMVTADNNIFPIKSEVIRERVAPPEAIEIIREGMRQAVTAGSAASLNSVPVELAGKTGTAEFGQDKTPHAWFTGFGPYVNPELVITVLIESGQGGNISATPIAKKLFESYFKNQSTP